MADRVLIQTPLGPALIDLSVVLEGVTAAAVCANGATREQVVSPAAPQVLLTAAELARVLSVDESWVLSQARVRAIPCVRAGKYVRFDASAVIASLADSSDTRTVDPRSASNYMKGKSK